MLNVETLAAEEGDSVDELLEGSTSPTTRHERGDCGFRGAACQPTSPVGLPRSIRFYERDCMSLPESFRRNYSRGCLQLKRLRTIGDGVCVMLKAGMPFRSRHGLKMDHSDIQ